MRQKPSVSFVVHVVVTEPHGHMTPARVNVRLGLLQFDAILGDPPVAGPVLQALRPRMQHHGKSLYAMAKRVKELVTPLRSAN